MAQLVRIGVDVGGTSLRVAAFSARFSLLKQLKRSVPQNPRRAVDLITEIVSAQLPGPATSIGLSVPGIVVPNQSIHRSANLPGWEGFPLAQQLTDRLGLPVLLQNDLRSAALGEAMFGAGKTHPNFLFVSWGSGIGGAAVERKAPNRWAITQVELGHQLIRWHGRRCGCGQRGCLEAYIGGNALTRQLGYPLGQLTDQKRWNQIARRAAYGLVNTLVHVPAEVVVFGGGIITKQPHLLPRISAALKANMRIYRPPSLELGKLGDESGLYGAAALSGEGTISPT